MAWTWGHMPRISPMRIFLDGWRVDGGSLSFGVLPRSPERAKQHSIDALRVQWILFL
jgi:hypothetical protein